MAFSFSKCTISCLQFIILSTIFTSIHGVFVEEHYSATQELQYYQSKMTHLHFFFHDIVGGKHPTAVRIAGPKNAFTTTAVVDDPLTEGPNPGSKLVGRAQGMYAMASQDSTSLLMALNFAFMEGKYNGSTISVVGRNAFLENVREMPIVGGSGVFRFARGYVLAKTVSYDPGSGDAVVEYNVFVMHG